MKITKTELEFVLKEVVNDIAHLDVGICYFKFFLCTELYEILEKSELIYGVPVINNPWLTDSKGFLAVGEYARIYIDAYLDEFLGINQDMKKSAKDVFIKKVIFNDPATIVFWSDGTKTVVKANDEAFDPEKGLAVAMSKKMFGNEGSYYEEFKKWLPKEPEKKEAPLQHHDNRDGVIDNLVREISEFCKENNAMFYNQRELVDGEYLWRFETTVFDTLRKQIVQCDIKFLETEILKDPEYVEEFIISKFKTFYEKKGGE